MKPTKKTILVSLAIALPVVLGGGYLVAKHLAWPRYKQYRAASFERSAREFLAKGDYDEAMVFVRRNLATNLQSTANWRLAVEIAEKRNDPNAIFFLKRLLGLEPSLENRLHLLRSALALHAYAVADEAISGAGEEARRSPEFHELAAAVSLRLGNAIQAKYHLFTLCELQPDNRPARLDLAQLRLAEAGADLRASIRAEIRALAETPALRTRALALLLNDSIRHDERREALDVAAQLRRDPLLPLAHALVVAEALDRYDSAAFPAYLGTLKQLAGEEPAEVARVALFLVSGGHAAEAKTWLAAQPELVAAHLPVQRAIAAAHVGLADWSALEDFLKRATWGDSDYERLVLIALAQRQLGNLPAFGETWRLALTSAGTSTAKLEGLRQRAVAWNWGEQRIEVLWRLFQQNPRAAAVQQQLFAHERALGNTANLNRLFARLLEASPDDPNAKNNYAYTSLLLGTDSGRAAGLAGEVAAADPKNPYFATTHALALLRSGKPAQARTVLSGIAPVQLWQPERVIIQAAVLVACGDDAEAGPLLASVAEQGLLPEEKRLAADTRAALERRRLEAARTTRIAETVAAHRDETAAKSFLALLPPSFRAEPSLPMELADSLYARDEFAPLAKELKSTAWEQHDFLRLALLAYTQRRLDQAAAARDTWRLAVNTVGTRVDLQRVLAALAGSWNWDEERIDLLARILQRAPADTAALDEVSAAYLRQRRTADLARVYGSAAAASDAPAALRARFAYYSLLVGSNTSEAHVAAKAAFDQSPADLLAVRALALSLWRQGQARAGVQILGNLPPRIAPEVDLSLVLALLHEAAGDADTARRLLAGFATESALPEEKALADELARKLQPKG